MALRIHRPRRSDLSILRYASGLTVRQLAARIGISPSYLCEIENGKYPGARTLRDKILQELRSDAERPVCK
jgi:transcriptional regulator with XRE-family HTH domain